MPSALGTGHASDPSNDEANAGLLESYGKIGGDGDRREKSLARAFGVKGLGWKLCKKQA